jgi:very-short-patch-repair endonuclease
MTPADTLKKAQAKAKREALEAAMALQLRAEHIASIQQYHFWPGRNWRFDFALVLHRIAIEVQGGTWSNGAHSRGSGIERDTEKAAHAAIAGWRLIPVTGGQIKSGKAIEWIKKAVAGACL